MPWGLETTELVGPAVVAALVSGLVVVIGYLITYRRDRAQRRRNLFAEAYSTYAAYKEFPYAVRRRGAYDPEAERIRLSEQLREIQERMSFHLAWTRMESRYVGRRYEELISRARSTAGSEVNRAWTVVPVSTDDEMNISDIDLSDLAAAEERYLSAVRQHLSLAPTILLRIGSLGWRKLRGTARETAPAGRERR